MSATYELYQLTQQYQTLLGMIEDGDIPEEAIADTLESLSGEIEDTVDNVACIVKQLAAEAEGIKGEETALALRRKRKEAAIDRLKDYIRQSMGLAGRKKIETARNCVTVGKPSQRLEITDVSQLRTREEFWKPYEWTEKNVDKAHLKEALKAGPVPGAKMAEGTPRLTIK